MHSFKVLGPKHLINSVKNRTTSLTELNKILNYLKDTEQANINFLEEKLANSTFLQELSEYSKTFESIHDISHELNAAVLVKTKEKDQIFNCTPYLTSLKIVIFQSSEKFFVGYSRPCHQISKDILNNQKPQKTKKKLKNLEKLLNRILTQERFKKNLSSPPVQLSYEEEKSIYPELQTFNNPKSYLAPNKKSESDNPELKTVKNEKLGLVHNKESELDHPELPLPNSSKQAQSDPTHNFRVRLSQVNSSSLNKLKLNDPIPSSLEKTEIKERVLSIPFTNYKQQPISNIFIPLDTSQLKNEVKMSILENSRLFSDNELEFNFK